MNIRLILAALLLSALAGCASPALKRFEQDQAVQKDDATVRLADLNKASEGYLRHVDELWIGDHLVSPGVQDAESMPAVLGNRQVSFRRQYPVTLQMVAEWVNTHAKVPVTVTSDAALNAVESVVDPIKGLIDRNSGTGLQGNSAVKGDGAFVIQFDGTVRGLLDEISARTGNSWVWRNDRAVILHVDTRSFQIHAIPGKSTVEARVSNQNRSGGQQGGGGGGEANMTQSTLDSGQTTTVSTEIETYDSITKGIEAMLSPKGKVYAATATGTVSVTDVPAVLDRVQSYIETLNTQMTRQVIVDVRVYSVDLLESESYGIDWNLVWENISGKYRAVTNLSAGPVNADASRLNLSVIDNGNTYGGSSALLRALSQQGNVTIKSSAAVVTLSNQPAPVQIAEETTYLAESATQLVANAGAATTLTQGKVVTGFSMNVLPVVLDSNDVLLQLQLNLSSLRGLREIVSGGQRIEAPQVDARQFLQRVKLMSGSTLVLSGFEQDRINADARGMGKPTFTLTGGSRNGERKHTVLVVTLTPKVIG
ncbi:MAG: type IVB pilus formation outer membrane protein, R64 PilN family [Lysobacterales bacterium 63-13]|nr:MAG: type IVB pilus formation outer membrane protein, R64 PilN family [Xanthomonadales bacterium 63-13]